MSILILGRSGQVARALAARLPDAVALGRDDADFEQPEQLRAVIEAARPALVINAAAYTAVDAAEDDRERAFTVNATAVGVIGETAAAIGAAVIHYSTDYVFDGSGTAPHREDETPHPLSVYGASKLAGEAALRASGAVHVILRVSWVYDPAGKNFPLTILRLARERETLNVVADQIGAPTAARRIAEVTALVAERLRADPAVAGTYHLAPAGETSWHGFAQFLVAEALSAGVPLKVTPARIAPIPTAAYPTKAVRPANSRLDTTRLRTTFGVDLPDWRDDARQFIAELKAGGQL